MGGCTCQILEEEMKLADLGSGPDPIKVFPMDRRDFEGIEKQDMEKLTYPDDSFEIVTCINALDHTKNPRAAIEEMIRICKPGGFIYIDCALIQHTTSGGWHYWDAEEDGCFVGEKDMFNLKDYGFQIRYIDNGGERRYNHIIATRLA